MRNAVVGGVQTIFGIRPHSPTRVYEDQASTIYAGYPPKNAEEGNRASSQPPSSMNRAHMDQGGGSINTPSLGIHLDGQTGHAGVFGPARKRTASVFPEGRPPKLPPTTPPVYPPLSPLTPELVGTNVSFPSPPNSQSPPEKSQQGPGGP